MVSLGIVLEKPYLYLRLITFKDTAMTKEDAMITLLIEVLYVNPLKGIIKNLEDGLYRDNDMDFLNKQVLEYTKIATKGIGYDFDFTGSFKALGGRMNEQNRDRFLKYFRILLDYFENLSNNH